MAVTWDVVSLDTIETVGSLSNVAVTAHWTATDSETVSSVEHIGYAFGAVQLPKADSGSFTSFDDITPDNAISWAKAALGSDKVTEIETGIATQITNSKNS